MDKIEFKNLPDQTTAISSNNLNQMQSNIEKSAVIISATEPTTSEKVWIKKGSNLLNLKKLATTTQNGLTWTPNIENDSIDVTGTSTGYSAFPLMQNFIPINDIIISLNGKMADATNVTTQVNLFKDGVSTDLGSIYRLDISEYDFDFINISLKRKSNVETNTSVKVKIEYGTQVTPYEKHIEKSINTKNTNGVFEEILNIDKINNQQNYKIEEQLIGTWLGKPLYRKVVETTLPTTDADGTYVTGYLKFADNVSTAILEFGFSKTSDGVINPLPYVTNTGENVKLYFNADNKAIRLVNGIKAYSGVATTISVLYTKTTD